MRMAFLFSAALVLPAMVRCEPPELDLCVLLTRPAEYRGRIVRVTGQLLAGFEVFALAGDCDESLLQERLCLEMPNAGPTASVTPTTAHRHDVVAIAEVSESDFLRSSAVNGPKQALDDLPWTPLKYEPFVPKQNKRWHDFVRLTAKQTLKEKTVTIVGRFEYVNSPSVLRHSDGDISFIRGYGHMGIACRTQLVVAEIVSIKNVKRHEAGNRGQVLH